MMYGKGLFKGLSITLRHAWAKDITIQYPEEQPYLQPNFRGRLNLSMDNCIVCGLCIKTCPNNVLSYESEAVAGSKKKRLLSYTIDLQYCMFCNLCVEACPNNGLYFSHDFELSTERRDDIKIVYTAAPYTNKPDAQPADTIIATGISADDKPGEITPLPGDDDKRTKQLGALRIALAKNPAKALSKLLEEEEDISILAVLLGADKSKLDKMAELMLEDRDKARKVAQAFVKQEKKKGGEGGKQSDS